jgi:hypothetical protein
MKNWNLFRIMRLLLGIIITAQALIVKDVMLGLAGLVFCLLPILNIGCCGVGFCTLPSQKKIIKNKEEIIFEEVK